MSTILLGTNRFENCRTLIGLKDHPLLQIDSEPLHIRLSTPPDIPSRRVVHINGTDIECPDPETRKRIHIIAETEAAAVFWDNNPLVVATRLDKDRVHVRLDLRALGINAFDDEKGLHVGSNTLCGNHVVNCETAIGLG